MARANAVSARKSRAANGTSPCARNRTRNSSTQTGERQDEHTTVPQHAKGAPGATALITSGGVNGHQPHWQCVNTQAARQGSGSDSATDAESLLVLDVCALPSPTLVLAFCAVADDLHCMSTLRRLFCHCSLFSKHLSRCSDPVGVSVNTFCEDGMTLLAERLCKMQAGRQTSGSLTTR